MLKTNFLGMELPNPVMIAAGPWNRDGKRIKESLDAGAGAVVTESIISDTMLDVRPRIASDSLGAENIRMYSDIQIAELAYMASKMERFGADAIELSVSNPAAESLEVVASHADTLFDMTQEVVSAVRIPVTVKLSQNTTNISKVAKAVKAAGGSGVTAINTVRGILGVDLEKAEPSLSTYGGISGEYIRPLGLASVATIAQPVDIPICGVGGIRSAQHALEYIMLGSSAVQVGTEVMLNGKESIRKIVQELEIWVQDHNVNNLSEIRGKALENLKAYDEMKFEPAIIHANSVPCSENCDKCIRACMYQAISRKGRSIRIEREKCTGCGLCASVCPAKKLKLDL